MLNARCDRATVFDYLMCFFFQPLPLTPYWPKPTTTKRNPAIPKLHSACVFGQSFLGVNNSIQFIVSVCSRTNKCYSFSFVHGDI